MTRHRSQVVVAIIRAITQIALSLIDNLTKA